MTDTLHGPPPAGVPDPPAVIRLRAASKTYPGGLTALADADLSIRQGELLAIVGPSGSGKSTLLNLMGTLDRPTSGTVEVLGHDVAKLSDRRLSAVRARWIGFVFQQFFLSPHLTAIDNVATGLLYHGVGAARRRRRAAEALEQVGLGHRLGHRPHEMSGGERQRTAIARALVAGPQIVLADEPTGALDSVSGAAVVQLLHDLNAQGTTIAVITHDTQLADTLPRRVRILDGRIREDTTAKAAV
ncbi:ABC transporter ATP-binding protein (plasmid) [Embleya sp. NBC_00888]|uniref:ABC transporter ATP-binding protein n=1 Tax=Embleya sp. NBC_00888 TaxID=2975960 RepID=UPI002F90E4D9|nr:ABC transporter ATP-binding protein [Embleya sp. NBC_00888]